MLRISNIKIDIINDNKEYITKVLEQKLKTNIKKYKIVKKSIDARKDIKYVYTFDVLVTNEDKVLKRLKELHKTPKEEYILKITGNIPVTNRPIIVGTGPAGLFLGYMLSKYGYRPLLIERGEKIEDRVNTVNKFWKENILNEESNVQFGEGGAGTFSDGKLNTLVKDKYFRMKKIFEIFIECGAPKEIIYDYKPHIGTDKLREVVINMRNKIINMGGEFRYNTKLTNIIVNNNKVEKIEVNNNEYIDCNVLVLAIGHSARDTFKMLYELGIDMRSKPFAVGVRVEHSQDMINLSQYGKKYKDVLPPATYKLTYQASNKRGVYSFCMCPGGYIVNASSENNCLVVNGMSNHKRDSKYSNSAIVVTVNEKDYGDGVLDGLEFQRKLERSTYKICGGKVPVQTLKGFYENKILDLGNVLPLVKGKYEKANLNEILPNYISDSLKEAFPSFGKKIKGFDNDDTLLLGVEARTSSPIRIERDNFFESSIKGIYPCGEGCGFAGGITSAAIDGIKVAEKIGEKYI